MSGPVSPWMSEGEEEGTPSDSGLHRVVAPLLHSDDHQPQVASLVVRLEEALGSSDGRTEAEGRDGRGCLLFVQSWEPFRDVEAPHP